MTLAAIMLMLLAGALRTRLARLLLARGLLRASGALADRSGNIIERIEHERRAKR